MCGIAGIYCWDQSVPIEPDRLEAMASIQWHRGPDEFGMYLDDRVGLAHNRLSIIDLTTGTQPIHNKDRTKWIVFNGEIFNYPELKKDLEAKGHHFYTQTDTEVLIQLYEEKGAEFLHDLNGQFALAIWDSRKQELFLARDRLGIVPLHYAVLPGSFVFASEIKSILASGLVATELDPYALDQIFTFWSSLPGRTAFTGIHQIPPGHCMTVSSGRRTLTRYWSLDFNHEDDRSDGEILEELGTLIEDALRIRLRADVQVGSYLSGGLDSTALTTLVKRQIGNGLTTFGIGFADNRYDESAYQDLASKSLGVRHVQIQATEENIAASLPEVVWHSEKPLLRTAPAPLYDLSRKVRESGFKVVITGEGADEIFGGYNIFLEAKARAFCARMPGSAMRPEVMKGLYPYIFIDERSKAGLPAFFSRGLGDIRDPFFSHRIRWKNTRRIKRLFSDEIRDQLADYDPLEDLKDQLPSEFESWDMVSRAQYLEITLFMSNYLLCSQGDRMAMAHSVEIRPPYLDHRIVEFMGRISSTRKIRGMREKYMLKKVFEQSVPEIILQRPKTPYRAPIGAGLLMNGQSHLRERINRDSISEKGLFDPAKVEYLITKIEKTSLVSETDQMALVGIISSQILHERFVKSFSADSNVSLPRPLLFDHRSNA